MIYNCFFCGGIATEEHEIFFGSSKRKLSIKHGLQVKLCARCHRDTKHGVHGNREMDLKLKVYGQKEFEKTHTREEFIRIFGRNYL